MNKLSVRAFQYRDTPVLDVQDGSQFTLEFLFVHVLLTITINGTETGIILTLESLAVISAG